MSLTISGQNHLFVVDQLNYRIVSFNLQGDFLSEFPVKGFIGSSCLVDAEERCYIVYPASYQLGILTIYDKTGQVIRKYGKPLLLAKHGSYGLPRYALNDFAVGPDSTFLVTFSYPYMIHFYRKGQLTKIVLRAGSSYPPPTVDQNVFQQRAYIWELFVLPDGKFFTVIRDAGEGYKQAGSREFEIVIDLYDREGHFLKSYPWDWRAHGLIKYVDSRGYLYTNFGRDPMIPGITKWKVIFE